MQAALPHSFFIAASYLVVAAVVALLIAWVVIDGRRLHRELAGLGAQGVRRRSSRASATGGDGT